MEESKLSEDVILGVEGMSTPKVRHFLNNLASLSGVNYLEIGTYQGSTLISALHGNEGNFFAIDNFVWEGDKNRRILRDNLEKFDLQDKVKFFDADCWELDLGQIDKKINVYFYDGDHNLEKQGEALTYFGPVLADEFIYIVDDWRDAGDDEKSGAARGTYVGIKEGEYNIAYEAEAPRSTRLPLGVTGPGYHQGLGIFVLEKNDVPKEEND